MNYLEILLAKVIVCVCVSVCVFSLFLLGCAETAGQK